MRFTFNKSMAHKFVVIDEIMQQLEAAKSGIVPGSVTQAVVSGIQNVPSNIKQHAIGGASSTSYTTFPLSPIVKNCCLDKSYLNLEFDVNYKFSAKATTKNATYLIPYYIGFRDNSSIFNQIQILIENSAIWTTTYQREESVLSYNSLPETEIRGNNQYSSIEKMREGKYSPMKRVVVEVKAPDVDNPEISFNHTIHFKCTVDINRLTPLLSNMHYTTPHMGNLRLKVFFQEFEKCMFICPDYNYIYKYGDGAKFFNQPFYNQYWQFYPLYLFTQTRHYIEGGLEKTYTGARKEEVPFYAINKAGDVEQLDNIIISNHGDGKDFMTFAEGGIAEIVQTCFDIKDEEYQRLSDYFASLGSVIIPSQTWSTNVFNNSTIQKGQQYPASQIGNIGGYNIDFISVWSHPTLSTTCFNKEFQTDVQLILDGRPINALPYAYINDKAIVDMTQAIIDTDHEEINHDFISSLTLFNEIDTQRYIEKTLATMYGSGALNSSINKNYISNPNTYALNFSTNLPDAFHSGACILENSNRQAVIRFNARSAVDDNANFTNTDKFPMIITHKTDEVVSGFSSFCDCCIVLTYDPARGTCFDGQLSWAAPYL